MTTRAALKRYVFDLLLALLTAGVAAFAGFHAYGEIFVRGAEIGGAASRGLAPDLLVVTLGCLCFVGALLLARREVGDWWARCGAGRGPVGRSVLAQYFARRLSRRRVFPLLVGFVMVCFWIAWTAGQARDARDLTMMIQWVVLLVVGTASVALSAARATQTNLPGLGRVPPQPPATMTLALLAGAPAREYVLFACLLPFSLAAEIRVGRDLSAWFAVTCDLLVLAVLYHALAALFGLALRNRAASVAVSLVVVALLHVGSLIQPVGCLSLAPIVEAARWAWFPVGPVSHTTLLGRPVSALLISLFHQVPLVLFLAMTVVRKTRAGRAGSVTKVGAIGLYLVVAPLLLADAPLGIFDPSSGATPPVDLGLLTLSYGLLVVGVLLVSLVTVPAAAFRDGLRRGRVRGWGEQAPSFAPTVCIAACCAAAGPVAAAILPGITGYRHGVVVSALVAACAILFWGLTKQAFALAFPRRGGTWFVLLMFAAWGLPLVVGCASLLMANVEPSDSVAFALSPLSSIGLLLLAGSTTNAAAGTTALAAGLVLAVGSVVFAAWAARRAVGADGEAAALAQ